MRDRDLASYMNELSKTKGRPDNPFGHAIQLLENEPGEVLDFSSIFDKQGMLAIIKDDRFVRLYQREINALIILYGLAKQDERLMALFKACRAQLFAELGITRAKEGEERKHQAALGGYRTHQNLEGFGDAAYESGEQSNAEQLREIIRGLKRG